MPLPPGHERARRWSFRRGTIFLLLASGAAFLAPAARMFGVAGGPLFALENAAASAAAPLLDYLSSKRALADDNRALRESVDRLQVAALERDSLAAERDALRAELEVPDRASGSVVAEILIRPPQTSFDSVVLGAGEQDGVSDGNLVLARGAPVGVIVEVRAGSSVATLFSAPESRLAVTVGATTAEAVGRGDGRYAIELPAQLAPATGTPVLSVAHGGAPLGYVATVIPGESEATVEAAVSLPIDFARARYLTIEVTGKK